MAAVWAQYFLPTLDFFAPGLVVLLQTGKFHSAVWAGICWMLIQEGTGGLIFGAIILFYAGLVLFFYVGGRFFEVTNFFFTLFLFTFLSLYKSGVIMMMSSLQELEVLLPFSLRQILLQAAVYLLVWLLTFIFFRKLFIHEPVQRK